jgi:hypothetical protein
MWNEPTKERLARIPKLYDTEEVPVQGKEIYLHFFLGGSDWFISETDGEDIMFGFCILNNDYEMAEWGYVSLSELRSIKIEGWLEVDCELEDHWKVRPAKDVDQIRKACGWMLEEDQESNVDVNVETIITQAITYKGVDLNNSN